MLLKHGGKDKYNVDHIGYNARLDTLQAAVLLAKFRYIDEFNEKRVKIAAAYNREPCGPSIYGQDCRRQQGCLPESPEGQRRELYGLLSVSSSQDEGLR
jgi:hypothetical protein